MSDRLQWLVITPRGRPDTEMEWALLKSNNEPHAFNTEDDARDEAVRLSHHNGRPFGVVHRRDYRAGKAPEYFALLGDVYYTSQRVNQL